MRILMFGWEFPPHISGGLGTACFGLTRGLSDLGQTVTFVMPHPRTGSEPDHLHILSASEIPMPAPQRAAPDAPSAPLGERPPWEVLFKVVDSPLRPYLREDQYPGETGNGDGILGLSGCYGPDMIAEVTRYGRVAGRIAAEVACDVIHGHDWMTVPAAIEARRINGRPYVYHVHALEIDRSGENVNPAIFAVERLGLETADRIIAVSHYTKALIASRYGIPTAKIAVVHNAVARREVASIYHVHKRPGKKMVLFMGRFTFQKGPEYFVEAAAKVLAARPEVSFVMAGTGELLPQMIERVAERGIGSRVHFTGFLDGADIERIFALSDLYVMPSVSEPFGITPLEAMLRDVPVVISKQSGVGEVLRHVPKVDFWDVDTLAGTIVAILTQPDLAADIVARSRPELETLRWENAARKVVDVYRTLIDPSP